MSWLNAIGSAFSWLGGQSLAASLVRTAVGIGLMRYLNKSTQQAPQNQVTTTPRGVRQQIQPATDNKIPVVYGDAYLGGTIFDVRLTNSNRELYAAIAICERTGDVFSTNPNNSAARTMSDIVIDDIYVNNSRVIFKADGKTVSHFVDGAGNIDTNPDGILGIYLYKGSSNAPMLPTQSGTFTPIAGTVPPIAYTFMPNWTSSHTAQNIVFAIVKLNFNPDKNLTSLPNFKFHVKNTLTKPGDVFHDYSTNLIYGAGVDESAIDNNSVIALNSYSDELVTYAPYPAQKRYTINGVVRTSEDVLSNMQRILASAGSYISYDNAEGKISVVINKPSTKVNDFDDSNILGQIAVTGTALDEYYNSVEVQFPYAVLKDQPNFVRIDLPSNLRNANEPDNQLQIQHELVNNVVQASILGNLELRQSREDLAITFETDYSKYDTQIGDIIGVTNSVYGWSGKLFKVLRVKRNDNEDGSITLEINAISYNSDVFTVEPISEFIPNIGADSVIPTVACYVAPTNVTVTKTDIDSQPSITISATVPPGAPVFEMEFWYSTDGTTKILLGSVRPENGGTFTPGEVVSYKTTLLNSGNYQFTARAVNPAGSSPFANMSPVITFEYIQAPNVLPYNVPSVDANGNTLDDDEGNPFNFGMLALYVASKLNWGGILSQSAEWLKEVFGLSDEMLDAVQDLLASEEAQDLIIRNNDSQDLTTNPKSISFNSIGLRRVPATIDANGNVSVALANPLTVKDDGIIRDTNVTSINFLGPLVQAVSTGLPGEINVTIIGDGNSGGGSGGGSATPPASCGLGKIGIGFYIGTRTTANAAATCAGKNLYFVDSVPGSYTATSLFNFYVAPVSGATFYEVYLTGKTGSSSPAHYLPSEFSVRYTSLGTYSYINNGFTEVPQNVTGTSVSVPSSPSTTNNGPTYTNPIITGTHVGLNNGLSGGSFSLTLNTSPWSFSSGNITALIEIRLRAFATQASYPATPIHTESLTIPINFIKLNNTQNYYNYSTTPRV